jgi:hypothetical protein
VVQATSNQKRRCEQNGHQYTAGNISILVEAR